MTLVDWIIVAFALLLAILGSQQGFVVGALSLLGFAAGAFAGSRLAPQILHGGNRSPYAPIFSLAGALLIGGVAATGLEGIGRSLRRVVLRGPLGSLDGLLGALLSAGVAFGIAWIAGAVALQTPGQPDLRRAVQRSAVLRTLNDVLPPSGPILNALARFDPLPALRGPSADVAAPRAAIARDPQVRAAAASVVRVLGSACGLGVEGSGWVAQAGGVHYVVTNAHVVAGQSDTVVQREGTGPKLTAHAVVFGVLNDVAILRDAQRDLLRRLRPQPRHAAPHDPARRRAPRQFRGPGGGRPGPGRHHRLRRDGGRSAPRRLRRPRQRGALGVGRRRHRHGVHRSLRPVGAPLPGGSYPPALMTDRATLAPGCTRPAAPDRPGRVRGSAGARLPARPGRLASTGRAHPGTTAARSII